MRAALPTNEVARLETLHQSGLLDSIPEQAYDDITLLVAYICETPMALISLVDHDRQWFKSKVGLDASETSREVSFCAHAILQPDDLMIVPDARSDARFADNPLVLNAPSIRFYAGAPLVTEQGYALGTLCAVDRVPRELTLMQKRALQALSRQVMGQLTLRQQAAQLQALNTKLEALSVRDELTGVDNRRAFNATLQREWDRAAHYSWPLSLLLIDVDHFKSFNDTFGHLAGDEVLKQVGHLLRQNIRQLQSVSRYGGEEFAVLLPDTDAIAALVWAESLRQTFEAAPWPQRAVTASFGIATTGLNVPGKTALIDAADRALYQSKERGRNCVTHIQSAVRPL